MRETEGQKSRGFLPATPEELRERGIVQPDFVYVIGDAYVDHPSFGPAIIGRVLENRGYTVAILSQPDWKNPDSIRVYGEPRLAFLVSSGNMDSMVNHYTVSKKRRSTDAYTPGGLTGKRPDRADIVYSSLIRSVYRHTPIILGGIEASLRRLAHYDYWSDSFRRSLILESGADLISYGMGERSIVEIADALDSGIRIQDLTFVDGTVYRTSRREDIYDAVFLPDYESMRADKSLYARSFALQQKHADPIRGKRLAEAYSDHTFIVQNPPARPLTTEELDAVYELPYMRAVHPACLSKGEVPAFSEVRFSLASCRGCFGACSFCALTFHQGRIIQARSQESLISEAKLMTEDAEFRGYIHDVGGPTADFRQPACDRQLQKGACPERQCLYPKPCPNLRADHGDYISLLRRLRALPRVKKVFIRSGIRFDYVLADPKGDAFLRELCEHHVSGQLKVAPEHVADAVLACMGKPSHSVYQEFSRRYRAMNERLGKKQYLVPYLMSSHPGCTLKDAVKLAEFCRDLGYMPEQVQDFYPTPSTVSTCMYYTGLDPRSGKPVYVPKNPHEKAMQRALIQYRNPKNRELVREALELCGRRDLIGFGPKCLIRPERGEQAERRPVSSGKKKKTIRNIHRKTRRN